MKKVFLLVTVFFMTTTVFAQDKNARATIEVDGICGMCKQRIERASLNTKGVKSAVWSVETHQLSLIFDERKTDLAMIQQNIADVGHDTHEIKATEEAYNSVHDCCKYRSEEIKDAHGKKDNN